MRKLWIGVAACVAVAGLAATGFVLLQPPPSPEAAKAPPRSTAEVVRGDLSEQTLVQGTLGYTGERAISGAAGTLTGVAPPGSELTVGGELFAIDNVPVVLFTGALPQWRAFELGMERGPDVQQLEASLAALGYFWAEPDEVFDANTRVGIRLWQEGTGRDITGTIGMGEIHFAPGPLRIAAAKLEPGAQTTPGSEIVRVTDLGKRVEVNLKLAQQKLAVVGAAVEIELPGGAKTTGKITAVDPPREPEQSGQGGGETAPIVPVTVLLDNADDAKSIDRATVRVSFTSETREDVLSVPVGALLALPEGGYGVDVVTPGARGTKRVAVETGLFAGGLVEITGAGIEAGTKVVVAES
ncbi:peptidoglycan-binding protein [Leucobacter albus]|uniref:Peptidoglycan-binding protein n=1 Tax=Leucobacter albus TaxID=272210 RepID=A0ABW3TRY9_9MICO